MSKQYLLVFGHSSFGAHQYFLTADSPKDAKEQAIKRLEASPMVSLTYELFEVEEIVGYSTWTRDNV